MMCAIRRNNFLGVYLLSQFRFKARQYRCIDGRISNYIDVIFRRNNKVVESFYVDPLLKIEFFK